MISLLIPEQKDPPFPGIDFLIFRELGDPALSKKTSEIVGRHVEGIRKALAKQESDPS